MANTTVGSRSRKKQSHLGWLPWAALLALLALAAVVWLILANVNDENDRSGVDLTDNEAAVLVIPRGLA
jgi:hypothetical protein